MRLSPRKNGPTSLFKELRVSRIIPDISGRLIFVIFSPGNVVFVGWGGSTLKTHTPQIWGVKISPPKFRELAPKSTVKQVIFKDSPPQIWGVNLTPRIRVVWVFRVGVGVWKACLFSVALGLHEAVPSSL